MPDDYPDFTGPTISANRRPTAPEQFLTLEDANSFARWSFGCGVFVGAVGLAVVLSILAAVT